MKWVVIETRRPDAGGRLYIPAKLINGRWVEADITPTYNEKSAEKQAAELNKRNPQ